MRNPSFSRVSCRHASWVLASFTWSTGSSNIIQTSFNVIEILWMDTSWYMYIYIHINWTYIAVKTIGISICNPAQWKTNSAPDLASYVCTQYTPRAISGFQFHRRWSSSLIIHLSSPPKKKVAIVCMVWKSVSLLKNVCFFVGVMQKTCFYIIYNFYRNIVL